MPPMPASMFCRAAKRRNARGITARESENWLKVRRPCIGPLARGARVSLSRGWSAPAAGNLAMSSPPFAHAFVCGCAKCWIMPRVRETRALVITCAGIRKINAACPREASNPRIDPPREYKSWFSSDEMETGFSLATQMETRKHFGLHGRWRIIALCILCKKKKT